MYIRMYVRTYVCMYDLIEIAVYLIRFQKSEYKDQKLETIAIVNVRVKTSLVHTSNFAWLMTCKTFLECYTSNFSNNKVMSNLLPANLHLV